MDCVSLFLRLIIHFTFSAFIYAQQNYTNCQLRDICADKIDRDDRLIANNFQLRNCFCDDKCSFYKDCCHDFISETNEIVSSSPFTCKFSNNIYHTYVYSQCKPSFNNSVIKSKCENISNSNDFDLLSHLPVIDTQNAITYKNIYCAVCNEINVKYLQSWSISFDISTSLLYEMYGKNFTLDFQNELQENENKWIQKIMDIPSQYIVMFPKINITIREPDFNSSDSIRRCKPHLISTCAFNWMNTEVEKQCHSYTAYRYEEGQFGRTFKNEDCARCNNVSLTDLSCKDFRFYDFAPVEWMSPLQQTFEYKNKDVIRSLEKQCPLGEIYNPREGLCKPIGCSESSFILGKCTVSKEYFILSLK